MLRACRLLLLLVLRRSAGEISTVTDDGAGPVHHFLPVGSRVDQSIVNYLKSKGRQKIDLGGEPFEK
jgi:hypothetical protein